MFYPYCTINDSVEVVHTPLHDGKTMVHFEEPDEILGFKTLDCLIPSYQISNIYGFSQEEINFLVQFCKSNAHLLIEYASKGGIANA